jgi:hypothetical protein
VICLDPVDILAIGTRGSDNFGSNKVGQEKGGRLFRDEGGQLYRSGNPEHEVPAAAATICGRFAR